MIIIICFWCWWSTWMDVLYSYFVYVFLIAEDEITLESLAIMPDNVLAILIPKAGPRALLVQKLREVRLDWLQLKGTCKTAKWFFAFNVNCQYLILLKFFTTIWIRYMVGVVEMSVTHAVKVSVAGPSHFLNKKYYWLQSWREFKAVINLSVMVK